MLHIRFTGHDLARTRLSGAHPLWETVLSVRALRTRSGRGMLDGWRARTRARLPRSSRILMALCPAEGPFAEFLMRGGEDQGWNESIEAIVSTPGDRLARELSALPRLPVHAEPLAAGDPAALRELGDALRDYRCAAITPYWDRIQSRIDVERSFRLRTVARGGVELLLSTLSADTRWDAGVLEVRCPESRTVKLDGRGLVLAPSVFCGRRPVLLENRDGHGPAVLFFPTFTDFGAALHDHPCERPDALSALLGTTRAAALCGAADGTTTTELARRLGVTPATASEHAKVLREAGLITTGRVGRQAVHAITPLGVALSRRPVPASPQRVRPVP
ncbi:helix-turn-helix transcriptional regulator [Actinomadura sp. WMMB 499]|uniref:ArsR/SmtB family transcription factor n=1 Tax=Actinomadura sp. WMMB 499 TaxID=1219491 RepID=UPI00159D8703|nr:winged helix-turn-helix domain-containing protein [Actinomadura sp. WMMB 499]